MRARFCNGCGGRLNENRHLNHHNGPGRPKLHADIAHPISVECRNDVQKRVFEAYQRELELSRQPGYVRRNLDGEDADFYHEPSHQMAAAHFMGSALA